MEHKTVTAADNKFSKSFPFCWEVGTHSIPSAAVNRILDPSRPSFRPSLLQARWSDRNLPTFTPRSDPNEGRVRWESGGAHCPHDERKEWDDNEPHQSFSPFNLLCGRWVRSWFVPHPISLCKEGANPPPSRSLSSSSVLTSWTERSGSEWWGDGCGSGDRGWKRKSLVTAGKNWTMVVRFLHSYPS